MTKADLARNYLTENNIGEDVPTKTIAKILHNLYPEYFHSVERARGVLKYIRGNNGDKCRNEIKIAEKTKFFRENRTPEQVGRDFNINPVRLNVEDYVYPYKKALILSDIHLPYHDLDALIAAVEHGLKKGVDSIYLNGDILDCYQISRFIKDPRAMSFNDEREMFWEFISYLKETNLPITFKMGNHEERWNHYLMRQNPELYGMDDFNFETILGLKDHGIKFVSGRQKCYMGKLIVIHGHEFGESVFSPVNPSRGMFLKAKCSVLFGHNHQTSSHHENNLQGDGMACFSTGALCQLNPEYRPFAFTKWNHGFSIVEVDSDGSFHVDNLRIIKTENGIKIT